MSTSRKRAYNSTSRHAQAALTRNRILKSAYELFASKGYEYVTIEQLAQHAHVSAPTIYALFQSKRGVLRALMDDALPAEQHKTLVDKAMKESSPEARLRISATIARQLYDAEQAHMDIFRSASILTPEFKELEQERERRRYERLSETVKIMVKEQSLLKELSPSEAHDILWAFTGRDFYRMLVSERKWSSDDYEQWLGDMLIKALLASKSARNFC